MPFDLELTDDQRRLRDKCHTFSREVIRPVAAEYDREQELPWPVLEEAAKQGLYDWQLYAQASTDPTGLSLAIVMEEVLWGCAGIGLTIVLPALALAAIRQAGTDEQIAQRAPQCFGPPCDVKLAAPAGPPTSSSRNGRPSASARLVTSSSRRSRSPSRAAAATCARSRPARARTVTTGSSTGRRSSSATAAS